MHESVHDPQAGPSTTRRGQSSGMSKYHHHHGSKEEEAAATVIQKHYRGYRVRQDTARPQLYVSLLLLPRYINDPVDEGCRNQDARWGELMKSSEEHSYAQEQLENRNDVRSRSV